MPEWTPRLEWPRRWDGGDESRVQALMAENQRLEAELDAAVTLIRRLQDERDLLRNAARAVIETSDAPTMTAEHEAILQLRAALDA